MLERFKNLEKHRLELLGEERQVNEDFANTYLSGPNWKDQVIEIISDYAKERISKGDLYQRIIKRVKDITLVSPDNKIKFSIQVQDDLAPLGVSWLTTNPVPLSFFTDPYTPTKYSVMEAITRKEERLNSILEEVTELSERSIRELNEIENLKSYLNGI